MTIWCCRRDVGLLAVFVRQFLPRDAATIAVGSRNFVRLSVTRVFYDNTKEHTTDILILHERKITSFLTPTAVDR